MYKLLVSDALSEEGLKVLKDEKELQVDVKLKLSPEELKAIIKDYDALVVRSSTKVTKDIIDAATKLKVIGRAGVGLDNVDAEAASKRGIIVMNTPAGNTISTCEHTWSLMLSMSRNVPNANASLKEGKWDRNRYMGVELYGKTLGIIGLGRIGTEVARRAMAFGMKVIACDPYLTVEKANELGIELVEVQDVIKQADYITVHTPLTNDTKHMIGDKEFEQMKPGVRIVNCARGGIIDEAALIRALDSGKVAGAALDVYENEPPKDFAIFKHDKLVATPHLGASTEEAQVNVAVEVSRQVADALLGRGCRNAVNIPCVDPEIYKILRPYITLAEKMGLVIGQLAEGRIQEIKIQYSGDLIAHDLASVTIAFLKGMLTPILQETVNFVNASIIAKERGIKIVETKSSQIEEFANLITIEAKTDKMKTVVAGTLSSRKEPRLVKINDFYVDAETQGYLLILSNEDKPGIIGQIGTVLGQHKINIAGMTLGRTKAGGIAMTVLNLDEQVPDAVMKEIRTAKHVLDAKLIKQ
ncbi:MAG: phosphoglycerate dehydrogenase [Omnitrophica WOR_2 bacterium RIFCSPLOWO2_12_FULL_51_24]|nr:MAG: phosphoglycerate dehydrogenase [Omnitrophica WOR_2 bacterium RIFCSPHIGHO2_01_FULL_49_10]OGX43628.1 MAG: phosphoglycerate dehydrogenase [Omnitrophica WOR_2 bacterium RIFCSPLOWO2_12_FULL_51_24]